MRHGNKINHLGRKTAHRKALLMNLSNSLIAHKRIRTTLAKAKELRKHIEPLLNKAKQDTTHNRRILFSYLQDKESIKELFGVIADKIAARPGGYTRIIKLGFRKGDAAEIAMIELVDFNEIYNNAPGEAASKKKRSRRGGGKSKAVADGDTETLVEDAQVIEETEVKEVVEETFEEEKPVEEHENQKMEEGEPAYAGEIVSNEVLEETEELADPNAKPEDEEIK